MEELPCVECDAGLVKLVFVSLLSNAAKYCGRQTPADKSDRVKSSARHTVLFVRNGVGY